jgi:peptide/nickel transport system substrate-binding protein
MQRFLAPALVLFLLLAACSSGGQNSANNGQTSGGNTANRQPKGELRVAYGIHMPPTLDATKDGFTLAFSGMGEMLTKITPDNKAVPWLAESVSQVDATTWHVKLRSNAKFWDGSAVTAQDVATSFRRNWDTQPAANGLISKDTQVTAVDPLTVEFKTPGPVGAFSNMLGAQQFVVHKAGPFGSLANTSIMTGPYKPVRFVVDNELQMEAFTEHWGGPPPIAKITIKNVPDANARALALQSGDVDMVFNLPPQLVAGLGPDFERAVIPSTRLHFVLFNHARAPFNDRAVREAFSLGIDRNALNRVALEGLGSVATNVFPPTDGIEIVQAQSTDVNRARQLLDEAGWRMGTDGVRVKDGKRLSFTLYSYPGRAELTPMATVIQSQLKPLGFDMQIQQVPVIGTVLSTSDWDVSMYSNSTLAVGDPLLMFNLNLVTGASGNVGKYSSPRLDQIVDQLRAEVSGAVASGAGSCEA